MCAGRPGTVDLDFKFRGNFLFSMGLSFLSPFLSQDVSCITQCVQLTARDALDDVPLCSECMQKDCVEWAELEG